MIKTIVITSINLQADLLLFKFTGFTKLSWMWIFCPCWAAAGLLLVGFVIYVITRPKPGQ
jgi:hypothetical protein